MSVLNSYDQKLVQIAQELHVGHVIRRERHRFEGGVRIVHERYVVKPPESGPDVLVLRFQLLPVIPVLIRQPDGPLETAIGFDAGPFEVP
ncbi:MAG: hypothetical protein ABSG18_24420 [Steroidobacteraceae bacterium]